MKRRSSFLQLVIFSLAFAVVTACLTQASDAQRRKWQINQNWFGVHFPNYRVVQPPGVTFDGGGLVSIPDAIFENIGENTDFAVGIKQEWTSRQRVLLVQFPKQFEHAGNKINLESKKHSVSLQWKVDDEPIVSVHIGQRGTDSILVDESTLSRENFDALLAAFRRGNSARVWLIVDGRPRISYIISLIGFTAAWTESIGDWNE